MKQFSMDDLRRRTAQVLEPVRKGGESVTLTSHGNPIAVIHPWRPAPEPAEEVPEKPAPKTKPKGASAAAEFERWWAWYPKKVAKVKALASWKRMTKRPSADEVIAFIQAACETDRWRAGKIPDGSTFVNQRRWEDDLRAYGESRKPLPFGGIRGDRPEPDPYEARKPPAVAVPEWDRFVDALHGQLSRDDIETFFRPLTTIGTRAENGLTVIGIWPPNRHFRNLIETDFKEAVAVASEVVGVRLAFADPEATR